MEECVFKVGFFSYVPPFTKNTLKKQFESKGDSLFSFSFYPIFSFNELYHFVVSLYEIFVVSVINTSLMSDLLEIIMHYYGSSPDTDLQWLS